MMKLGIMQPYFMPHIGYWQLIKAVDKYVVYDDVNFIKQGWINRNNLLIGGQKKLFTIILNGASPNKLINEIDVKDDFVKFRKTLTLSYCKAPYYAQTMQLLDVIFEYEDKHLGKFLYNSICQISNYLGFDTEILLSSEIEKDNTLKAQDKVIDICKNLNATSYYNASGGQELYDRDTFSQHGVDLKFIHSDITPYKQFKNEFVSGLSIIDVLMFNSVEEINIMLDKYNLK